MSESKMDMLSWVLRDPQEAADEIERLRAALREIAAAKLIEARRMQDVARDALEQKADTE